MKLTLISGMFCLILCLMTFLALATFALLFSTLGAAHAERTPASAMAASNTVIVRHLQLE